MNDQEMKLTYMMAAQGQRILRGQEVRARNKARKASKTNYPTWGERRESLYQARQGVRTELRYLHLARAFTGSVPYLTVEQSTREGNEVDIDYLQDTLNDFGYYPCPTAIAMWIGGGS